MKKQWYLLLICLLVSTAAYGGTASSGNLFDTSWIDTIIDFLTGKIVMGISVLMLALAGFGWIANKGDDGTKVVVFKICFASIAIINLAVWFPKLTGLGFVL